MRNRLYNYVVCIYGYAYEDKFQSPISEYVICEHLNTTNVVSVNDN